MSLRGGRFGEINNTAIPANVELLSDTGLIGRQTPETSWPQLTKLGIQAASGTAFKINGVNCVIGKTGIFEIENTVVESLIFPNGASNTTIIDYIY